MRWRINSPSSWTPAADGFDRLAAKGKAQVQRRIRLREEDFAGRDGEAVLHGRRGGCPSARGGGAG